MTDMQDYKNITLKIIMPKCLKRCSLYKNGRDGICHSFHFPSFLILNNKQLTERKLKYEIENQVYELNIRYTYILR